MSAPSNLRDRAVKALRKYRAILMLTNNFTIEKSNAVDELMDWITKGPRRGIKITLPDVEKKAKYLSSRYGCRGTVEELENIINYATTAFKESEQPSLVYLSKFRLEELFSKYEQCCPAFPTLPPHARIGLDFLGIRQDQNTIELYLLEAALFEDLAALWNETHDRYKELEKTQGIDPIKYKLFTALLRSTAKAAYNLLEGYLNGMAFDILLTQDVSEKDEIKLLEWDKKKKRKRFLTLRDKVIQYPKIAVGSEYPVLDEGNFPELEILFLSEKTVRNTLIHPNPYFNDDDDDNEPINWKDPKLLRESPFFNLTLEVIGSVCDLIIDAIFRIDKATDGKFQKVDRWLFRRDENGKFPTKVFI